MTLTPGASVSSANAPISLKCLVDNTSAGSSTAATGTPRARPWVTRSVVSTELNSAPMAVFNSWDAAYRPAMVSNRGSANCSGSPSQVHIARHCRGESRHSRTYPSRHLKVG